MPHDDDYKCQMFLDSQSNHPSSANHVHQQFTSDTPNSASGPQHYVMSRMLGKFAVQMLMHIEIWRKSRSLNRH